MLKLFQEFIKESEDLLIPRNLEGRDEKFFRNVQRKLDSCNGFWEGDLNLNYMNIPSWLVIPDNLKVAGSLDLSETNILELPKNLHCKWLKLYKCKNIKELPEDLNIEITINLHSSSIEKLPKNLQCETLYLQNCKNLKELSEGLKVKYTINLSGSSIEQLPENLQCKDLWLSGCKNIKELPEGLNVEYLYIEYSSLTKEYCVKMKQEGKIYYRIINYK